MASAAALPQALYGAKTRSPSGAKNGRVNDFRP